MKYKLETTKKKAPNGKRVFRVHYHDGIVGGYVQGEHNLSHDGDCRILDKSIVYGKAKISGSVLLNGRLKVYGSGELSNYFEDKKEDIERYIL